MKASRTRIRRSIGMADGAPDPERLALDESRRKAIAAAIERLPERERLVLSLYYEHELNLKEIGAVLKVTESRICQLHGQALLRLRGAARGLVSLAPSASALICLRGFGGSAQHRRPDSRGGCRGLGAILKGAGLHALVSSAAFMIVIVGTIAAICVQTPLEVMRRAFGMLPWVFHPPAYQPELLVRRSSTGV